MMHMCRVARVQLAESELVHVAIWAQGGSLCQGAINFSASACGWLATSAVEDAIMDPSAQELQTMATLEDVYTWVGISAPLRAAIDAAFGSVTLIRQVVLVPRHAWDAAVILLRVQPSPSPPLPTTTGTETTGDDGEPAEGTVESPAGPTPTAHGDRAGPGRELPTGVPASAGAAPDGCGAGGSESCASHATGSRLGRSGAAQDQTRFGHRSGRRW